MNFIFVCIISMWLMIGAVGLFYVAILPTDKAAPILMGVTLSILISVLVWVFLGYPLAFGGKGALWGQISWVPLLSHQIVAIEGQELLNLAFQLCFMLYAVVMLIGSVIDRVKMNQLLLMVSGWILLVYAPLAHWIWHQQGWLNQLGVIDFSGGLVVHLSAGLSAFVLAAFVPKSQTVNQEEVEPQYGFLYLSVLMICFGWFGFNMGPVGEWNQLTSIILLNTFLAIVGGGFGWLLADYKLNHQFQLVALLNGMVCGLVASTSGVGSVSPLSQLVTSCVVAFVACYLIEKVLSRIPIVDAVDSFGMNGIGGALGSLAPALFASRLINPSIKLAASWQLLGVQVLAILVTSILSIGMTYLLGRLVFGPTIFHLRKAIQ